MLCNWLYYLSDTFSDYLISFKDLFLRSDSTFAWHSWKASFKTLEEAVRLLSINTPRRPVPHPGLNGIPSVAEDHPWPYVQPLRQRCGSQNQVVFITVHHEPSVLPMYNRSVHAETLDQAAWKGNGSTSSIQGSGSSYVDREASRGKIDADHVCLPEGPRIARPWTSIPTMP